MAKDAWHEDSDPDGKEVPDDGVHIRGFGWKETSPHTQQTFDNDDVGPDEFLRSIPGAHEFLQEQDERFQNRPPTIELSPEYGQEVPLWREVSSAHVPDSLMLKLKAWQSTFESHFDPETGWDSDLVKDRWATEAVALEAELRGAAVGEVEVEVDLWPLNPGFVRTSQLKKGPPMI